MSSADGCKLAEKYFVNDLSGAARPGARLHGILERIDAEQTLSAIALAFLEKSGLDALHDLATGTSDFKSFCHRSMAERATRIAAAKVKADAEAAAREEQAAAKDTAIKAQFEKMASDPAHRRKREAKELRQRYGLSFVDPDHYHRVMKIMKQVEAGRRIAPEDLVWLSTEAEYCWTPEFRAAYHGLEALAFTEDWEQTGDPWAAVNASSHWRKAEAPEEALKVTEAALALKAIVAKPASALCTTRGGAMRDLARLAEARDLGHEAHRLTPDDYRPCTLLGAVYTQLGEFKTGQEWYRKAEGLGAERHAIDQDLRGVLARAAPNVKAGLSALLLSQDEQRFGWVREWLARTEASTAEPVRKRASTGNGRSRISSSSSKPTRG